MSRFRYRVGGPAEASRTSARAVAVRWTPPTESTSWHL